MNCRCNSQSKVILNTHSKTLQNSSSCFRLPNGWVDLTNTTNHHLWYLVSRTVPSHVVLHLLTIDHVWSETTLNYGMMVEKYPNLKEEVAGSNLGCEISSLPNGVFARWSTASCALALTCLPYVSEIKNIEPISFTNTCQICCCDTTSPLDKSLQYQWRCCSNAKLQRASDIKHRKRCSAPQFPLAVDSWMAFIN